ncbi:sulfurtransferase [Halorarius litoreus]|uniref:sulfurtransferase n=1 Tax=Halorarius litoreus TaxID=2962676 RepID=UPI0020CE9D40|nr:sulfurtransferase [Halorarius litoreus]
MHPKVVPPSWLAERLDEVHVVDVRDAWEFEGIGHVPGAVNVPFDSFRGDDGEAGKLPGAEAFADLVGDVGISTDDRVVAYDDHHGVFAARFLVTAELYGHDPSKLHLLDGDFSAWQRAYETTSEVDQPTPVEYEAVFDTDGPLVPMETVQTAVDSGAVIVDTREPWEFAEGHIPGAVQLDWQEVIDEETRGLLPEADLRDLFEAKGITPEKRVLLYCNTARRISHTYVTLRHLGYEDLAFYEGSLTEWEREGGTLVTEEG